MSGEGTFPGECPDAAAGHSAEIRLERKYRCPALPFHRTAALRMPFDPRHTYSRRIALTVLLSASVVVGIAFVPARLSGNPATVLLLEDVHWTVSAGAAAALAWLGVRSATAHERAPRRWFAFGLTFNLLGQLVWDLQGITLSTPIPNLIDALFLAPGACCVLGLIATLRTRAPMVSRPFMLDVTALSVVILTLTLDLYVPRRQETMDLLQLGIL